MKIIYGYYFEFIENYGYNAITVTTNGMVKKNGELVMGAGLAKEFADRWPELPKRLGSKILKNNGNNLVWLEQIDGTNIIAYPTKFDWKKPSPIELIKHGIPRLIKLADTMKFEKILLPPFGCGLGGLTWGQVKNVMETLDDRFHVCLEEKNNECVYLQDKRRIPKSR